MVVSAVSGAGHCVLSGTQTLKETGDTAGEAAFSFISSEEGVQAGKGTLLVSWHSSAAPVPPHTCVLPKFIQNIC